MISPRMNAAVEPLGCSITPGTADIIRRTCPTRAMATAMQTALYRPVLVSAIYAPNRGVLGEDD
jgi:hypothetical protein